jgi:hypothetical protein
MEEIFSKHKVDKELYKKKIKAYKEAFPSFQYDCPS